MSQKIKVEVNKSPTRSIPFIIFSDSILFPIRNSAFFHLSLQPIMLIKIQIQNTVVFAARKSTTLKMMNPTSDCSFPSTNQQEVNVQMVQLFAVTITYVVSSEPLCQPVFSKAMRLSNNEVSGRVAYHTENPSWVQEL